MSARWSGFRPSTTWSSCRRKPMTDAVRSPVDGLNASSIIYLMRLCVVRWSSATGVFPTFPCLPFAAACRVPIAFVTPGERKRRQPGLAADDPAFVGRHQLVWGIQRSEVDLDLGRGRPGPRRAAARTEEPPCIVARFAFHGHRLLRK